jgi:hypothetical protein
VRLPTALWAAAAIAVAASTLTPAIALGEPSVWDGRLQITAVSSACAAGGIGIDLADYSALYRPKLQDGDPNSALVFFTPDGSFTNLTANDPATQLNGKNVVYDGTAQDARGIIHPNWSGTVTFTIKPAPVVQADTTVQITGRIFNFANVSGCTLTISAAFLARP